MTDVNVQFFSHLNGLNLGNNWGDLIRLLDICLVNGKPLPSIILQTVDPESGDITLEFSANHSCMLLQIVELNGFSPSSVNTKYRVKGVPNDTTLILKADNKDLIITSVGTSKLSPLGYDIIFRDEADVKRVYRSKNPTAQHPFIRVDESLASPDGTTGMYASTYAKYAMVGLLEHMEHIDDYENPDVLQLPFDPSDPAKNWKIAGTGDSVVRGWSKWYWCYYSSDSYTLTETSNHSPMSNPRFTLVGTKDYFYLLNKYNTWTHASSHESKTLKGCGVVDGDWFLMSLLSTNRANQKIIITSTLGGLPFGWDDASSQKIFLTRDLAIVQNHVEAMGILPDFYTGSSNLYNGGNIAPLQIPIFDASKKLRMTLPSICYAGKSYSYKLTTPIISEGSMYVWDNCVNRSGELGGGFYFYLGEVE